ncbi:TetR/AcrR family transcriptional regulator [Halostagnicola bangensis]
MAEKSFVRGANAPIATISPNDESGEPFKSLQQLLPGSIDHEMTSSHSPSIPDDTYEELIEATVAALYKKGYANLGVRDIDAEFSKSRQLINHYFDGKDELITELLLYLLEFDEEPLEPSDDDPVAKLNEDIDNILLGSNMNDDEFWMFMTVIYDIQSQAHHNPDHQELINQISDEYIDHLSEIIRGGIDRGVFTDVDPVRIARIIDGLITGAHIRKINLGQDEAPAETRETIDEILISRVLLDSAE